MKHRITALMVVCLILAGAVLVRAAQIQIFRDERLTALARKQFQSRILVRPSRGMILDRNGEALAVNAEIRSLAANPSRAQNKRMLARLLARATDQNAARLLERLQKKAEFVWIKRHLSEQDLSQLKKLGLLDASGEPSEGLMLVKESKRVYPHGELAAHVIGAVNLDGEGLEGVELWAEEKLKGRVAPISAIRDALGRPTFLDAVAAKDIRDGSHVQLTLDSSLQFSAEQELRNAVVRTGARSGGVLVMDAVSGEILAMANEPTFNLNDKGVAPARKRNRLLTDGYEPGSVLKAVHLATALQKGMRLTDQIHGELGSFKVQGHRISEAETHEKFGMISLKRMIQVSSNVVSAKLALKLGPDATLHGIKALGFGSRSGSGFPGEIPGRIPERKAWSPLATANIGFGQGILATPMQVLRSYAAFANGGYLVQPTLLRGGEGAKPEAPKRILPAKVAELVTDALHSVTGQDGTGIKAALEGYRVAGKTGTSQVVDPATGKYSRSRYIASFVGYATGVEPRIVILTLLDEPKGIYYASETAAPLFQAILRAVANRFSLPAVGGEATLLAGIRKAETPAPQPARLSFSSALARAKTVGSGGAVPAISDQLALTAAGARRTGPIQSESVKLEWQGAGPGGVSQWKMPSLRGLTTLEAAEALKGHRFKLETVGEGLVRSQVPEPERLISDGGTVRLILSDQ